MAPRSYRAGVDVTGPSGVGRTAVGMARLRAAEGLRSDKLFDDPYAAPFVAAAPLALPAGDRAAEGTLGAAFAFAGVIRTRFYDDYLTASVLADRRQVVLMAAGLDSRAFRLAWPAGVVLYELDLPEVLRFKADVLNGQDATSGCRRVAVPVDLRGSWVSALLVAGFESGAPTAWLVEGLLIYLTHEEAVDLLTTIGDLSAPGSQLATERQALRSGQLRQQVQALPAMREFAAMWQGGLREDLGGWLERHGWTTTLHDRTVVATSLSRSAPPSDGSGFVVATRSDRP